MADRGVLAVPDPEGLRERYGYPELTETAKRKILGQTSAKLYGIRGADTGTYRPVSKDYDSRMTNELKTLSEGGQLREPDHSRYWWMRVEA